MQRKLVSVLLGAALLGTMFTGCGQQADAGQAESKTESSEGTSGSTEEESKDADKIVYWSMWDAGSPQAVAIQEAIDAYCEETGNEVQVEWKGRDIASLISSSIDAGEDIDLYEDDYMRMSTIHSTYAMDLEEMAKAADYDNKSNTALTGSVRNWAGSLKVIPYQPYASGVFYNKEIFDEVGAQEPATWNEFLDVCEKIKQAGYTPLALDDGYVSLNLGYALARYIGQDGVKDVVDNGNWAENPGVLKMAEDMQTLVEKGYLSDAAPEAFPEGQNAVGFEETAMVVNASWIPNELKESTECEFEWGMFSYPAVEGGTDGTEAMMIGGQGISINAKSENAQAAFDLVMFLTTGEYDAKISAATNAIPSDPNNKEWPEIIKNCRIPFEQATKGYEWAAGMENNTDFTPTIVEWGSKLFSGACSAQEFVDGLEAASK